MATQDQAPNLSALHRWRKTKISRADDNHPNTLDEMSEIVNDTYVVWAAAVAFCVSERECVCVCLRERECVCVCV